MERVGWGPHPRDAVILGYCSSLRAQQAAVVMASLEREIGPSALLHALKRAAQESTYFAGFLWSQLISVYSLSTPCVPGFCKE